MPGGGDSRITFIVICSQAGPMKSVHLPRDKESGMPKKFAFVEFEHGVSVPYACQLLDNINLFGRPIQVKPSTQGGDTNSPSQSPLHIPTLQRYPFNNAPMTPPQDLNWYRPPRSMGGSPNSPVYFQGSPAFQQPWQQGNWGYNASPRQWNPQMGVNPYLLPNFTNYSGNRSDNRHRR